MKDVWPFVREERLALITDLEHLTDAQWETPSLCEGWSVHDVLAHVVDTARASRARFVRDMVVARFDFDRQNQRGLERARGTSPTETLDRLRAAVDLRRTPPAPLATRLVEAIVHGEDIRRPLDIQRSYRSDAAVDGLLVQARTSASMGGAKSLLEGLVLSATDVDLTLGEGATVEGDILELLLVACGRAGALDRLTGPGVAVLRERLAGP